MTKDKKSQLRETLRQVRTKNVDLGARRFGNSIVKADELSVFEKQASLPGGWAARGRRGGVPPRELGLREGVASADAIVMRRPATA